MKNSPAMAPSLEAYRKARAAMRSPPPAEVKAEQFSPITTAMFDWLSAPPTAAPDAPARVDIFSNAQELPQAAPFRVASRELKRTENSMQLPYFTGSPVPNETLPVHACELPSRFPTGQGYIFNKFGITARVLREISLVLAGDEHLIDLLKCYLDPVKDKAAKDEIEDWIRRHCPIAASMDNIVEKIIEVFTDQTYSANKRYEKKIQRALSFREERLNELKVTRLEMEDVRHSSKMEEKTRTGISAKAAQHATVEKRYFEVMELCEYSVEGSLSDTCVWVEGQIESSSLEDCTMGGTHNNDLIVGELHSMRLNNLTSPERQDTKKAKRNFETMNIPSNLPVHRVEASSCVRIVDEVDAMWADELTMFDTLKGNSASNEDTPMRIAGLSPPAGILRTLGKRNFESMNNALH